MSIGIKFKCREVLLNKSRATVINGAAKKDVFSPFLRYDRRMATNSERSLLLQILILRQLLPVDHILSLLLFTNSAQSRLRNKVCTLSATSMPSNSSFLGKHAIAPGTPLECYSPSRRLTYSTQFVSIQTVKYGLVLSHLASYEIQLYRATVH